MPSVCAASNVNCERKQAIVIDRRSADQVLQRGSFQVLHRNEGLSILVADVVDGADVRMIESRCRPCLPLEAGQCLVIAAEFRGQELESDKSLEACVQRLVDNTHPAAAKFFDDLVMRDGLADHVVGQPQTVKRLVILEVFLAEVNVT